LKVDDLAGRIKPFFEEAGYPIDDEDKLLEVASVLQVRLKTLAEAPDIAGFFFQEEVDPEPESLIGKMMTLDESLVMAKAVYKLVESLPDFKEASANQPLRDLASELGLKAGHIFTFLRNTLTAQRVSPPIFETMTIIGREKVLARIRNSIKLLDGLQAKN
jgi:glutamyl-tRNA synthetase